MRRTALAGVLTAALALPAGAAAATVPGRDWASYPSARAAGLDGAELSRIAAQAATGKSNCLLVSRRGRLVREWQFHGITPTTPQAIFSMTKSITSALVGIAVDDGDLAPGDSASRWIPEWRGTPAAAVTIADLLSNDSGRQWSPVLDYRGLILAPDQTAFAVGLQQTSAPGTVWVYNNAAIQTLQRVLAGATGEDVVTFAQRRLFDPLGMRDTHMGRDRSGQAQMFYGVTSTCRDMARFGTLFLDHGRWGGRQIVSARWVRESTGRPSTPLNAAYGYLWWLNRAGVIAADPLVATSLASAQSPQAARGRLVPGAPEDLFWALGLGNQLVQVDPGSGTVVVRLGSSEPRPQPPTFGPVEAAQVVTRALLRR